jgi:uncharacterized membrane protein YeaQ/YmgE (transglycosylase-associated protein family)
MGSTVVLATVNFKPEGIIGWIVVGLIAGFFASHVMGDGGFGFLGDTVVGLIGAFVGGLIVGALWTGSVGIVGSIVVAFIGACVLIWLVRLMSGGRVAGRSGSRLAS